MVTWHAALASELGPAVGLAGGVVSCVQPQEPRGAPGSSRRDSHTRQKGEGEGEGEGGMGEGGAGAEAGHVEELQNPFVEFTAIAATKVGAVSGLAGVWWGAGGGNGTAGVAWGANRRAAKWGERIAAPILLRRGGPEEEGKWRSTVAQGRGS